MDSHMWHANMLQSHHKRLEISTPLAPHTNVEAEDELAFTPTWAWLMIKVELLKEKTTVEMEGLAPPGDLERRIQEYLDTQAQK